MLTDGLALLIADCSSSVLTTLSVVLLNVPKVRLVMGRYVYVTEKLPAYFLELGFALITAPVLVLSETTRSFQSRLAASGLKRLITG
jgi:hypothetical protein